MSGVFIIISFKEFRIAHSVQTDQIIISFDEGKFPLDILNESSLSMCRGKITNIPRSR
jgi:hypothetical protein